MRKDRKFDLSDRLSILRILFGLVWLIDAILKYEPSFWKGVSLLTFIRSRDAGEPHWLNIWFHFWYNLVALNPQLFAILIIIIESLIALSLVLGIARRLTYLLAMPFMFIIWAVGEAFGGPYVAGTTDINAGLIYVLLFYALYISDRFENPRWSLDSMINKQIKWWPKISQIGLDG